LTQAKNLENPVKQASRMLAVLVFMLTSIFAANAAQAQIMPESFADLAESVSPAVVNITTSTTINAREDNQGNTPFDDLFRNFQDRDGDRPPERRGSALGSGFIISADGYVVTNNHVIVDADEIVIELFDGGFLDAVIVGRDERTDLALLKVEADEPLPFVNFGDSDIMRVGDWVLAIGNPLGQGFSVSAGIVSARGRTLSGVYDDFIQTDAAINRGNSGGPLFNLKGEVIGVNTAILSPSGGSIGIGFSMASAVVENVILQLREFGETRRGWLGVSIRDLTEDLADEFGLENTNGVYVIDVPEGPAKDAGILTNDVILTFDGEDVLNTRELISVVALAPVGGSVRVVVFRDGNTQTLLVTLGRLEDALQASASTGSDAPEGPAAEQLETHGMLLAELNEEMRDRFMIGDESNGVVILQVEEGSDVAVKGLRPGDVIVEVAQAAVQTPADVLARIDSAREAGRRSVLLLVRSQGSGRFVALSISE